MLSSFRLFDKKKYIKHKLDRRSVDYVIEDSYDSNKYIGIRQLLRQRLKTALEERREFRNTNDLEDIELNTFERKEVITVLTPYFADEHLKFTDAQLYFAGAQLYFAGAQLYFAGAQLYFAGGHPTLPVDTLLCRWTPYFAGGHPTLSVHTLL